MSAAHKHCIGRVLEADQAFRVRLVQLHLCCRRHLPILGAQRLNGDHLVRRVSFSENLVRPINPVVNHLLVSDFLIVGRRETLQKLQHLQLLPWLLRLLGLLVRFQLLRVLVPHLHDKFD